MRSDEQSRLIPALTLVVLVFLTLFIGACRKGSNAPEGVIEPGPAGEPDEYSATIVRTIENGEHREVSVARILRSSSLTREEWTEGGAPRALIFRPDLGKIFLLAPDRQLYSETFINPETSAETAAQNPANDNQSVTDPEAIENAFSDAPNPSSGETRLLPDQIIDNHPCEVIERRAVFPDNHIEITREFRARDLAGLTIRVEAESNGSRIITERRDIKTEVSPDEFKIPDGFKRVEKLPE